ncbi:MAG: BamA/TamA family outer membrane protein [Chitinophagales bacterium]
MQKPGAIKFTFLLFLGYLLFALPSCKVTKEFTDGQYLLVKNKIDIKSKLSGQEKDKLHTDLGQIALQKPNRKFLGMPVRMWIYYSVTHKKKLNKFRQWLLDKLGEEPVIVDTLQTDRSEKLMENYLFNYGYFYADVNDSVVVKNKKAKTIYTIVTGEPWKIGTVTFPTGNTATDSLVRARQTGTLLRKGDRFDIANLKAERIRVEDTLRNNGYYFFSREYVTYDLDTSGDRTVNIKMTINQPSDTSVHEPFKLDNIYVVTDYYSSLGADTIRRDTVKMAGYYFISQKRNIREKVMLEALYLQKDYLYTRDAETRTLSRISQLGAFRFISIDFDKSKTRPGYLDGLIRLTPAKRHAVTAGGEINVTNEGLFGTAGSFSYRNSNLSKRADQLLIDLSVGIQLKFSKKESVKIVSNNVSASVTYYLNRFVPFKPKAFANIGSPKTKLRGAYTFENRFDFDTSANVIFLYQLHNFNFSFGYDWLESNRLKHFFNPLAITFYLIPKRGQEFTRRLDQNPILKSSFEEQIIIGPNYTLDFNNLKTDKDRKYMRFISNVEVAGNVPYAIFKLANLHDQNDSIFYIFKRPFSQYFRIDADWRNYIKIRSHATFAIRTYAGIGVPYGNSYALPFIKQFFVGGPNSLRGFLIREVGPGGYVDTSAYNPELGERRNVGFFNQTGDIKLELNAEMRFDIYKWLKGAVFIDAGNVWTVRKDTRALGNFDIKRFWKEFAVDAGVGLRLDFNFFQIRFDYGFPLRDPRKADGDRWLFENAQFRHGQFQLGVGYPF